MHCSLLYRPVYSTLPLPIVHETLKMEVDDAHMDEPSSSPWTMKIIAATWYPLFVDIPFNSDVKLVSGSSILFSLLVLKTFIHDLISE